MTRASRLCVVALALALASGCAAVIVGGAGAAAGYAWVNGNLKQTLTAPLPRAERAARETLAELDLVAVEGRADKLKARLSARMADGTKVRVELKAVDFETTTIRIRVGALGDRAISEQILRHLERRL